MVFIDITCKYFVENAIKSYISWEFTIMDHGPCSTVAWRWVQVMIELFLSPITDTINLDVLCKQKLAFHCCVIYAHNYVGTSGHIVSIILAIAPSINLINNILYSSAYQWPSCNRPITVPRLLPAWGLIIILLVIALDIRWKWILKITVWLLKLCHFSLK